MHELTVALAQATSVLLTAPGDLDGDAVGAIVALEMAIERRWPQVRVRIITDEPLPARYLMLVPRPSSFRQARHAPVTPVDLAVVLDGGPERFGLVAEHFAAAKVKAQIDHHRSSTGRGVDIPIIDPGAASTTQQVLRLCDRWGVTLDRPLAAALFAGLVFDTSIFRYRLATPSALRDAARMLETGIDHAKIVEHVLLEQPRSRVALRALLMERMHFHADGALAWALLSRDDVGDAPTGGLVDDLVFIEGVEVGALLMERASGQVKLSLRSRGQVDVAAIAQSLSARGGGHARAAGATLTCSTLKAARDLTLAVEAALSCR